MEPDIPILAPPANLQAHFPSLEDAAAAAMGHAAPCQRLTILVNDPQRQTLSRPVLEAIASLFDPARTRILVAAGSHRFSSEARAAFARKLTGDMPYAEVRWHDSYGNGLSAIDAPGGWIGHPWLIDPGGLLAIGSVEPHYFAGFTGAHKTATIGCASYEDIQRNHSHAADPCCRPCRLDGNPVYMGICAMVESLRSSRSSLAAVNLVQAGDRLVRAFGGDIMETLHPASECARRVFVRHIEAPADCIIAEVAGPLAASFYQADKGIKNNEWAVRDGGCLVLVAPCPDGVGQDRFMKLLHEADTYASAVAAVEKRGYRLGDHKAVRLRYLTDPKHRAVRVFVVSHGLGASDAATLGVTKAGSVEKALSLADINPEKCRVFRVLDAGNTCVLPAPP
jgi:nickel-dependent lactate racemase